MMEDAVLLLLMLFVLVMASFMLDKYSCMLVSQSGFALVFGLLVGLLVVASGRKETLNHHLNLSNNLFFDILLPPIIYEGGFSIKRQAFFRNFPAIMSTAVFGTVIATCVTGGALYLGGVYRIVPALSWVEAFLFGSLISAVDPVATLACFNKLHAPPLLFNLVFGESVMNDAVAIALYQTLAKWEPDIDLSAKELLLVAANTGGMFVCSLLVSMAITLLGAFLLKRKVFATLRHYPAYEISLCLIFSLLTYFIADSLHLSGIVALFFSGTMTAHYHFHTISKSAQHSFTHLLHTLAFISENFVYLFMGTSVVMLFAGPVEKSAGAALRVDDIDWTFIGLTLLACVAARFCNIFPLLGLSNCTRPPADRIPVKYMSVIWFAGLRGSIAFALAKSWQYKGLHNHSHKKLIESTTLMIVIFTTLVIGGLTGPLLTCLNLADSSKRSVLMTDTESSANESPDVTRPRSRSESTAHARRKQPGSAHYVMSRGSIHHPRDSMSDAASVISDGLDLDNPDTVLTPRPQFQDTSDDDDDQWDASLYPRPPTIHRQASLSRRESYTGAFFRTWNFFDASYMQPIFGGELAQADAAARRPSSAMNHETLAKYKKENVCYPLKIDEFPIIAWSNLTGKLELHPPHWNNLPSSSFGGALRIAARHYAVHRRRMAPPTYYHGSTDPLEALGDDMSGVGLGYGGASHDNNAGHDGGDSEEATDATAPLPSVETMEDLIIEAYNNMQSDGEHIFLPTDVASKLQFIAEMVKGAGYTSDDLVSNSSESNQEEGARALLPSGQHDTAPRSEASSAPSSPPIDHLSFTDTALSQHISHLQLDGNHAPSPVLDEHRKPIEPLQLDSNNFEDVETTLSAAAIASNAEFAPALSPVQEIAEDLLSISDFGSIRERPQETLTPPRLSTSPSRERAFQGDAKPKSKLRKPEVHRKTAVPARPLSNKSLERNNPPSSATRSHLPRARTESQTPPTSRERSTSSSYEQRREAAQKLRDEKAQRELQARDAARKQREEARLKLEEAQQKESAAKRERATRMRMQKDSQRKGPPKSGPKTR